MTDGFFMKSMKSKKMSSIFSPSWIPREKALENKGLFFSFKQSIYMDQPIDPGGSVPEVRGRPLERERKKEKRERKGTVVVGGGVGLFAFCVRKYDVANFLPLIYILFLKIKFPPRESTARQLHFHMEVFKIIIYYHYILLENKLRTICDI